MNIVIKYNLKIKIPSVFDNEWDYTLLGNILT